MICVRFLRYFVVDGIDEMFEESFFVLNQLLKNTAWDFSNAGS